MDMYQKSRRCEGRCATQRPRYWPSLRNLLPIGGIFGRWHRHELTRRFDEPPMTSLQLPPERELSPSKRPYVPTAALDAVFELKECKPSSSSDGVDVNIAGAS